MASGSTFIFKSVTLRLEIVFTKLAHISLDVALMYLYQTMHHTLKVDSRAEKKADCHDNRNIEDVKWYWDISHNYTRENNINYKESNFMFYSHMQTIMEQF